VQTIITFLATWDRLLRLPVSESLPCHTLALTRWQPSRSNPSVFLPPIACCLAQTLPPSQQWQHSLPFTFAHLCAKVLLERDRRVTTPRANATSGTVTRSFQVNALRHCPQRRRDQVLVNLMA
jgi:hypothetical protein